MLTKEYRIVMPMTVDEFKIGQLYSVSEASLLETGGGEGIEVVRNENFDNVPFLGGRYNSGQYTYKKYHLASKVPAFLRLLAPKGALEIIEEAWNAYPYCKTVITNPGYMKENFSIIIESLHLPDRGETANALQLTGDKLSNREVIRIDIASNDLVNQSDYKTSEDPAKFRSAKTKKGPLTGNWRARADPVMCCYKVVHAEFRWFGFQNRVENFIQKFEKRLFTNFHRQVFCWIDRWYGMTLDDIRVLEERVRTELDNARRSGAVRGIRDND